MPNIAITDNDVYFDPNDSFDEKTFQLELQVADTERRELAAQILKMVMRLAHMRARDENVAFEDVWPHIFDWEYMRADIHGSNRPLAKLAEHVHDALEELADMRRDNPLPRPKRMRC